MSTPTSLPPPQSSSVTVTRRVPPPCWSKVETLALVEAYKDRWFALRRGHLKASDWDAVADAVSSASDPGTTKSSVQCRHKIEKLRKRYRAEKQRSLENPGKFSSYWDLYPLLDSMNFASTLIAGSEDQDHIVDHKVGVFDKFCLKSKKHENVDGNSGSNLGFDHEFRGGCDSSFDFDHKFGGGYGVKWQENRDFVAKGIKKFKRNGRIGDEYGSMVDFDHSFGQGVDSLGGFPLKTLGDRRSFVNLGFKPNNYGCPNPNYDDSEDYSIDELMGFRARDPGCWDLVPQGFHGKKCGGVDRSLDPGGDCRGLNEVASCSRPGLGRNNASAGVKRGMDPVEEIVSSIKLLAEGFVRIEKMKIEMVKEIEKMRMEMEMKHNEMILESQQKIMDVFSNALLENKIRKKKPSLMFPNVKGNGIEEWQGDNLIEEKKGRYSVT